MNRKGDLLLRWVWVFFGLVVLGAVVVGAVGEPSFKADTYDRTYYFLEDTSYLFNFSENVTGPEDMAFYSVLNITSTNHSYVGHSNYIWFVWDDTGFDDSGDGVMVINATYDNQTGNFTKIDIYVQNATSEAGTSAPYNFMVNATNDRPTFVSLDLEYNMTQDQEFYEYINASDEEDQYPLWFNITWFTNCTHAAWSDRDNCSLFQPTNVSDIAAEMNFTPVNNDVGSYWANVTIMDYGEGSSCPNDWCYNDTYAVNMTWYRVVEFNLQSSLSINVTNCTGLTANESAAFTCTINISTQGAIDSINVSTVASLRNYDDSGIANASWFYANETVFAESNSKTIAISFTADKPEIGNWTINFTADDLNDSIDPVTEQIQIYVNRTSNDDPAVTFIENVTTSINLETTIYLNASDDDLLIPDKEDGFNETLNIVRDVTDSGGTDANYLFDITNGTTSANFTHVTIVFTPNSTDIDWYTVNISVTDADEVVNSTLFNITISNNLFPSWNQSSYTINLTVAATQAGTSQYEANLTDTYVNDSENDDLTFSNTTNFTNFNLTTYGVLNFTPWKQDVGTWEVNITATDEFGLANTTTWTFNISNTNSEPSVSLLNNTATTTVITDGAVLDWNEDVLLSLNFSVTDNDFLILTEKETVYNETLSLNLSFFDFSTGDIITDLFSFTSQNNSGDHEDFYVEYTPGNSDVGSYNVTFNITDASGVSDYYSFNLTISASDDSPVLSGIYNQTLTNITPNNVYYMDVNASDEEDGTEADGVLNFTISSETTGGDFFTINGSGVISFTVNATSLGAWEFNVSVNDSTGGMDSEIFNVTIYGTPIVDFPASGYTFNLTENTTSTLEFTVNHTVAYNLTYDFWIDRIVYSDSANYSYGNLTLRESVDDYGNGSNYSWSFTPNFTDETYGLDKNLTLVVYPASPDVPNASLANTTVTFKLNVTHKNSPVVFDTNNPIGSPQQATYNQNIELNLTNYFVDVDADDPYYNQTVNFTISSNETPSYITSSMSGLWILTLSSLIATSESLKINGTDWNVSNGSVLDSSDVSGNFQVTFTAPSTTTVPTSGGGGGGGARIKHYSLKLITPQDIIVMPEKNIIEIPFSIQNDGQVDLKGINLSSYVSFNDQFTDGVKISLEDNFIEELKFGQSENFTMVIRANTQRSGRYKATIFANVTTPKFSDWADFFIDLRKTNETEAEQLLLFTEKFISENPECLELVELLKEAKVHFDRSDFFESYRLSQQAVEACEEAISSNEQVRFDADDVRDSFYYISFVTLVIFFAGFLFYVYKRIRFNKAKIDNYI